MSWPRPFPATGWSVGGVVSEVEYPPFLRPPFMAGCSGMVCSRTLVHTGKLKPSCLGAPDPSASERCSAAVHCARLSGAHARQDRKDIGATVKCQRPRATH